MFKEVKWPWVVTKMVDWDGSYLKKTSVIGLIPLKVVLIITSVIPLTMFLITVMNSPRPTTLLHQVTKREHFSSSQTFSFLAPICWSLFSAALPSTAELSPSILLQTHFSRKKNIWKVETFFSIKVFCPFISALSMIDFVRRIASFLAIKLFVGSAQWWWRPDQVRSSQLMTMRLETLSVQRSLVCFSTAAAVWDPIWSDSAPMVWTQVCTSINLITRNTINPLT